MTDGAACLPPPSFRPQRRNLRRPCTDGAPNGKTRVSLGGGRHSTAIGPRFLDSARNDRWGRPLSAHHRHSDRLTPPSFRPQRRNPRRSCTDGAPNGKTRVSLGGGRHSTAIGPRFLGSARNDRWGRARLPPPSFRSPPSFRPLTTTVIPTAAEESKTIVH